MRLTESQIREILRKELTEAAGLERLDEFTGIKAALTQIFKGLGAVIGAAFGKASSTYDPSKFNVTYEPADPGKSEKDLSPKTDAYDQVYALGRVLWHIDTAISMGNQSMGFAVEKLNTLEFPVEKEDESFSQTLQQATEDASTALGFFKGYLSKAESSKVSDIGANIEPGQSLTDTLKNFAAAVSELEALNPTSDWENIVSSKAVQQILDKKDESTEKMRNMINQVKGDNMQNIPKLGELKSLIDQANQVAVQAEEVMDFAADEAGEKPKDSSLLDHYEALRPLIREILSQ